MKRYFLLLSVGLAFYSCIITETNAQSTTITPGNNQPNITATSTNNGVLIPQIALTNDLASASPVINPASGLLVFNSGAIQTKGFYYWTGTAWQLLGNGTPVTATAPISIASNNIMLNAGTGVGQLLTWDGYNWVNTNPKITQQIDIIQPYLTLNFCIALQGIFPSQNASEPFLGEISMYGFSFNPKGWAMCNGQIMSIAQNQALFALLGTTYGGNGVTTFGLPDLRGRVPVHMGQGNGLSNYVLGQAGGSEKSNIDNKY